MLLTTIASGLNALFSLRSPSLTVTSVVVQLVAYPLGVGWDKIVPSRTFTTFGLEWSLKPGPFNMKEHGLIVIMANAAFGNGVGYFTDTIVAQRGFYGQNFGWGFNILLAITTQCVGFGIAGLMRRYLVEPASMIWPKSLVNTAFLYALHDHSTTDPTKSNGWSISRYRYFFYVSSDLLCGTGFRVIVSVPTTLCKADHFMSINAMSVYELLTCCQLPNFSAYLLL